MKTYEEIVRMYQKRQHDTIVDTISTGLTYADELAVESGLLEETGVLNELSDAVSGVLPFVVIAATEGSRVILKKKPLKTGLQDGAYRMLKSGAAMGIGAAVMSAGGLIPAIPVTMGVRALFDRYRSKALTGNRVAKRTERLKELNRFIRENMSEEKKEEAWSVETTIPLDVIGTVE